MVHDLSAAASARVEALGATACASAREVADRAATVFLCLPSVGAAQMVARELATGRVRVVVETSTVGPGVGAQHGRHAVAVFYNGSPGL